MAHPSVDIDTDRKFQERFWIAVRIGWVAMAVLLLLAIMGFTGSGGAYSSQKLEAGNASVEVPAVSRWAASDTLKVTLNASAERTTVLLPAELGDVFSIEAVNPQPQSVSAGPEGDEFVFQLVPAGGKTTVEFSLRPSRPVWRQEIGPFRVNSSASSRSVVTILP